MFTKMAIAHRKLQKQRPIFPIPIKSKNVRAKYYVPKLSGEVFLKFQRMIILSQPTTVQCLMN